MLTRNMVYAMEVLPALLSILEMRDLELASTGWICPSIMLCFA